jgi:hypothetical protein
VDELRIVGARRDLAYPDMNAKGFRRWALLCHSVARRTKEMVAKAMGNRRGMALESFCDWKVLRYERYLQLIE